MCAHAARSADSMETVSMIADASQFSGPWIHGGDDGRSGPERARAVVLNRRSGVTIYL